MQQTSISVVADLADKLRRDISLGILQPGERLSIEALKRAHGVSHPSVREALSLLLGEGYVFLEEQKGFRVLESSVDEQRDISRVRAELEAVAIGWSIAHSTRGWRAQVVATHYALTEAEALLEQDARKHVLEWDELNRGFHLALASNCHSPKLISLITMQYDLSRRYRLMAHGESVSHTERLTWLQASADEHLKLREAALTGDADTAQNLLRSHILKGVAQGVEPRHADEGVVAL